MLRFCANLSFLFTEVGFLERFERAASAGFIGVECVFPFQWQKEALAERLKKFGLEMVVFALPAGDWEVGERGIACLPGREGEFQESVGLAIEYAQALNCTRLNCLAGLMPRNVPPEKVRQTLVANLRFAATALQRERISLLVEALNEYDMPGFYLTCTRDVLQLFKEVGDKNLWLEYDIYHMQIMEGNLTRNILDNLPRIAHIQLGDNPGRHEPGTGEINFPNLLRFIDEARYYGWIGCEYRPVGRTEDGLEWVKPYLKRENR